MEIGVERIVGWKRYGWLRAGFSARAGGVSTVYGGGEAGELNLGWTASDDAALVAENRRRFLAEVAGDAAVELVTLRQVHGAVVRVVGGQTGAWRTPEGRAVFEGDGMVTGEVGVMLGVQTADCVPVLLADTRTRAVAALHAGWRGTLAGIAERGVAAMRAEFGTRPEDVVAAIGPGIRPCCFAVGAEVREQFGAAFGYAEELFREVDEGTGVQMYMDLQEANRRQLMDAGLGAAAVAVVAECTACARTGDGRRKYFSHRAEKGFTGRMLGVVGVVG